MSRTSAFGGALFATWAVVLCGGCVSAPAEPAPAPSPKDEAQAAYLHGLELGLEGRHAAALAKFQQAASQDPLRGDAHYRAGLCYYQLGEYELEAAEYRKALAINPNHTKVWRALALSCVSSDDLDGARRAYRQALVLEPSDARVRYNLALVEADLGQTDEARRLFERCVSDGEAHLRMRAQQRLESLPAAR